jgi:hypothetical protein
MWIKATTQRPPLTSVKSEGTHVREVSAPIQIKYLGQIYTGEYSKSYKGEEFICPAGRLSTWELNEVEWSPIQ